MTVTVITIVPYQSAAWEGLFESALSELFQMALDRR
jgi:hypothetical protein